MILLTLILITLDQLDTTNQMTVAGVFDEGDIEYAEVFRLAVEDVNRNRYFYLNKQRNLQT